MTTTTQSAGPRVMRRTLQFSVGFAAVRQHAGPALRSTDLDGPSPGKNENDSRRTCPYDCHSLRRGIGFCRSASTYPECQLDVGSLAFRSSLWLQVPSDSSLAPRGWRSKIGTPSHWGFFGHPCLRLHIPPLRAVTGFSPASFRSCRAHAVMRA